jgi:hypothetical protein
MAARLTNLTKTRFCPGAARRPETRGAAPQPTVRRRIMASTRRSPAVVGALSLQTNNLSKIVFLAPLGSIQSAKAWHSWPNYVRTTVHETPADTRFQRARMMPFF